MGSQTERGQILIELLLGALFLVAFFLMGAALGDAASKEQEAHRFARAGGSR